MAYRNEKVNSIQHVKYHLKNLLPVFFLFGEDTHAIENSLKLIQKNAEELIESDFDKEIITAEKNQNIAPFLDIASAFPFGSGKKLVILKNFERISDKKNLKNYVDDPPEFTILILVNYGKINDVSREPFKSLQQKEFLFEARELKGADLVEWLRETSAEKNLKISFENANLLIDLVGEEKSLLEMQLEKFRNYVKDDDQEITAAAIEKLTVSTKEFSIFDLQNALSQNDKSRSLKIAYNLINNGQESPFIIAMLTRFITTIAQVNELKKLAISEKEAAKKAGVSFYYYRNCSKPGFFRKNENLINASRALFKADLLTKTTSTDQKTLVTMLVSELLGQK